MQTHKKRYGAVLMGPTKEFVATLAEPFSRIVPDIRVEPKGNGSIMRMNHDMRFSQDKTPYNTQLRFVFWLGGATPKESPGFYLRLSDRDAGFGAGMARFPEAVLETFRQRLDEPA